MISIEAFRQILPDLVLLTLLFVPAHQGLVELYKLIGARTQRYFEALAWIVYGSGGPEPQPEAPPIGFVEAVRTGARLVPEELGPSCRRDWIRGAQRRLIEGFVLRAVGDSPVAEVSDADVENVVQVARSAAPPAVRRTVEVLEGLLEAGVADPDAAARALRGIDAEGPIGDEIERWIATLEEQAEGSRPAGVLLEGWRRSFLERHLPGELRARTGLANALKSAELRYHQDIHRISAALAGVEALAIAALVRAWNGGPAAFAVAALLAFGVLLIAPRATKSLLDAIIGVGARLRG